MNSADQLRQAAATRILVKDGAYGTQIQARRLREADYAGSLGLSRDQKGNNDLLNLTQPELVRDINVEAARIIREVADADGKQRWVAGALGPTNKTLSMSPDVNDPGFREVDFDLVSDVYVEQIEALVEGGVETMIGRSGSTRRAAWIAALALSVSNTVSISTKSTPPSTSASICST